MTDLRDVVIYTDTPKAAQVYARALEKHGFHVRIQIYAEISDKPSDHKQVHVFFVPKNRQILEQLKEFQSRFVTIPIVWCVPTQHSFRRLCQTNELRMVLPKRPRPAALVKAVRNLAAVGKWSAFAGDLTSGHAMTLDTLDVQVILDRTLQQLSAICECKNIRWISAEDMPLILYAEAEEIKLGVEGTLLQSPHIHSFHDVETIEFLTDLRQRLAGFDVASLPPGGAYWFGAAEDEIIIRVADAGYFYFEQVRVTERTLLTELITGTVAQYAKLVELAYAHWKALKMSFLDDLTELYNQKYLPMAIEKEIHRSGRTGRPFSLLFLDLDFFKRINDSRGHWVGSKLLVAFADLLKHSVRSCDYGFRYGGDEFIVLLVDTDSEGAKVVAERIRKRVEDFSFLVEGHVIRLTVSIGLASYPDHAKTTDRIIQLADQAMYHGKSKSRNIVYIAS